MRISDWSSDVCSSDLVDGVTKTSFAGGKASIVQAGDAADAEDSVRGNLNATGLNGAEVTVSAKARNVIASAGGVTETVGGSNAVTSGTVTTTTVRNDVTRGGGSAKVTETGRAWVRERGGQYV